jgi:hypothetical protein
MSKLVYCYTCNLQHPMEEMRKVTTAKGMRWRCIKTIVAARLARDKRQEFGARASARNNADAKAEIRSKVAPGDNTHS